MKDRLLTSIVVALALATVAPAQQPTFRAGVDLIAVDVTVVDGKGRPVPDLRVEDFTLTIDGRARRIASVEFIALGATPTAAPKKVDAAFSTNEGASGGRLIVLVIDQGNIRQGDGRPVMAAAGRFLDRLTPADRVGLAVIPAPGASVDFTANHRLIREALGRVVGRADRFWGTYNIGLTEALALENMDVMLWAQVLNRECAGLGGFERQVCEQNVASEALEQIATLRQRTMQSLGALRALIQALKTVDAPKTLVLISEGLFIDRGFGEVTDLGQLAASARTSVYVLQLDSPMFEAAEGRLRPTATSDQQVMSEGLETLAGTSRGTLFRVISAADPAFERIALELSGYYLLGVEPEASDREPKPHQIRVQVVKRPGLTVRARREFVGSESIARAETDEGRVSSALRSPFLAGDLPLKVTTYNLQDASTSKLRVLVGAEIGKDLSAPTDLVVGFVLMDEGGRGAAQGLQRVTLTPPEGGTPGPLTYLSAVLVEPGTYTLKLAAINKAGHLGSVDHRVEARLSAAGDLRLGDLLLAEGARTADAVLRPMVDPRVMPDRLGTYLEVYSNNSDRLRDTTVTIELAENDSAPALVSVRARTTGLSDPPRLVAQSVLPLALLPPGSYVARAVVAVEGRPVGRITRAFQVDLAEGGDVKTDAARAAATLKTDASASPSGAAAASARGGASRRPRSIRLTIDSFRREEVLRGDVLSAFLDRLSEPLERSAPPAVAAALADAKRGRFDTVLPAVSGPNSSSLAETFLRGLALFSKGELEAAAANFRAALRMSSDFLPAAFYLGACYAAGGHDRPAVGAWQTSLVAEPETPIIYQVLADGLLRLGEIDEALAVLREASDRWPDEEEFKRRFGVAYAQQGKDADALQMLDAYLARHPADHETLFLAMRILYEARTGGRAVAGAEQDRERLSRYAQRYLAANGPHALLVKQWEKFFQQKTR